MAVVNLAVSILLVAGNLVLAVRLQPALLHPRFDKAVFRELLGYGGALTVAGLALVPLTTAQRFFLALNHSTTAVAYLAVAGTLATTLQILPEQLTAPFLPGLARLEAGGRLRELRSLYCKGLSGLFLLVTPAAVLLAFICPAVPVALGGPRLRRPQHGALPGHARGSVVRMPGLDAGLVPAIVRALEDDRPHPGGRACPLPGGGVATHRAVRGDRGGDRLVGGMHAGFPAAVRRGATGRVLALPATVGPAPALTGRTRGARRYGPAAGPVTSGLTARLGWAAALTLAYGAAVWFVILTSRERHGIMALAGRVAGGRVPVSQGRHAARAAQIFPAARRAAAPSGTTARTGLIRRQL